MSQPWICQVYEEHFFHLLPITVSFHGSDIRLPFAIQGILRQDCVRFSVVFRLGDHDEVIALELNGADGHTSFLVSAKKVS
jgi:hypothetical protein